MSLSAQYHSLPLTGVSAAPALAPITAPAALADPALVQMTDFRQGPCVVVDHMDGLDATLNVMLRSQVHMALVSGVDGEVLGMVSRDDLQGEKPVQRALADHIKHDDLVVQHVMTPASAWQVANVAELNHARLGDVVATLREHSLRYLLVVEPHAERPVLRGVFSARHIEAALGMPIGADLHSNNFAELESSLGR